jgi:hypothetical protein
MANAPPSVEEGVIAKHHQRGIAWEVGADHSASEYSRCPELKPLEKLPHAESPLVGVVSSAASDNYLQSNQLATHLLQPDIVAISPAATPDRE